MAFGIAPRPITAFKGVRALEQAHWIKLHRGGGLDKRRYWQIPVGTQDASLSETDAVDLLDEQLTHAVRRRLVADVPVGTFMSGGIDSTTISAIAAQLHPGIKAFTLGYEEDVPEMDEVPQARATAKMYPMQHIVEKVGRETVLDDLKVMTSCYEEPFFSISSNHEISRLVSRNQVTVVLNGLGGDELFAGYGYYRFARFTRIPGLSSIARFLESFSSHKSTRALSMLGAKSLDRRHTLLFRRMTDGQLHRLLDSAFHPSSDTPELLHDLYAEGVEFSDGIEAFSYMDMLNYLGNHHVHRVDQFTMAFSIEGRFPFLDHEFVEAAYRIPSRLKLQRGMQKYVLRRVAERYIAAECLSMKKKGFGMPLGQWMDGPLRPIVDSCLTRLLERPEVHPATISNWRKEYSERRLPPTLVWHLVALELWFERFIDGAGIDVGS